jgi:hypothetical protein
MSTKASASQPPAPEANGKKPYDTCVIGAGPAGLAVARALQERDLPYTHLERHSRVGGIWDLENPSTPMYESAHFNSSRTMSGFAGFPMPDTYADYPPHRDILTYLRSFADAYALTEHIEFGVEVAKVTREADGDWRVTRVDGRQSRHRNVVMCSGSQWFPYQPEVPGDFSGEIRHAITYRNAEELKGRRVLVVGAGASGCDIACDAARTADYAAISMRRGYWFIPKHLFGRPVDTIASGGPQLPMWLEQRIFGLLLRLVNGDPRRLGLQKPTDRLFETHPSVTSLLMYHLQHGDLTAKPGITATDSDTVTFADGTRDHFDLILFATGYRHKVPYAQEYLSDEQHPDLYLSAFSREHPGLFGVGYVETNSAAYGLFDIQAQMIASYIRDTALDPQRADRFAELIRNDRPDLSGGLRFSSSPRHKGYVNSATFKGYLHKVAASMGWRAEGNPPPTRREAPTVAVSAENARRGR